MVVVPVQLPLFVFGTLRDPEVLEIVLGRPTDGIEVAAASLPGHRLARLPDESYPVLQASPEQAVEGALIRGLTEEDFQRIRFFENEEYCFEHCRVVLSKGGKREPALYCSEGAAEPGAHEPWTLESWQSLHKAGFIKDTKRFMRLYKQMSAEEADREWRRWKER